MASTLNAISSNNVVLENEVIVATIVFDSTTGKITHIIRKDATGSREETESATGDDNDSDTREYYYQELQALWVSLENHRNIEDLVLMPGIVDAHVHLNEVCYYPFFFFFSSFLALGQFSPRNPSRYLWLPHSLPVIEIVTASIFMVKSDTAGVYS